MSRETQSLKVSRFLRDRVGNDLRSVISYGEEERFDLVYYRDDLREKADELLHGDRSNEYLIESLARSAKEDSFDLGTLNGTVHFFEEATAVNIHVGEKTGVAASFDPGSVSIDKQFIDECRAAATADE